MSVLAFKDCQQKVVDLITARALFVDSTIVLQDGKQHDEIEEALRTDGEVVIVLPLQGADGARSGLGAAILDAKVDVIIAWNPERGTLNIYEMVTEAVGAVLEYFNPNTPNDRFTVESVSPPLVDDAGSWAYLVSFKKAVQMT